MLTFAHDTISRQVHGTRVEVRSNCRFPLECLERILQQIDRLGRFSQVEARDTYFACVPEPKHHRALPRAAAFG
jgi:hypothetical protein